MKGIRNNNNDLKKPKYGSVDQKDTELIIKQAVQFHKRKELKKKQIIMR